MGENRVGTTPFVVVGIGGGWLFAFVVFFKLSGSVAYLGSLDATMGRVKGQAYPSHVQARQKNRENSPQN